MKVVIPGGTGQDGTVLARDVQRSGDEVVVLSREPVAATGRAAPPWRTVGWDAPRATCVPAGGRALRLERLGWLAR